MVKKQPEALRLADWCDANSSGIYRPSAEAAAELRRLYDENDELKEQRDELLYALQQYLAHASEPECAIWRHIQQKARTAIAKATGE